MNRQITRLGLVALVLMVSLIAATTYWQTWAAAGLADRQDNAIKQVAQFTVKRGKIRAADGTILARNRAKRIGGRTFYFRRYPMRGLFAHVVGYSTQSRARAGLERSQNDWLTGANTTLNTVLRTTLDRLRGVTITGDDLVLTLKPKAQQVALLGLGGRCGAAVALDPRNGKVLALASSPTFDPNLIESNFARANRATGACAFSAPLFNRTTNALYPPGSTFKVLTTAAALDSGRYTPSSSFYDPGYCIEYGRKVFNAGNPEVGPESFGHVDFTTALEHSINAVFCNVGKALGPNVILNYAKRFGFYSVPPLETPSDTRSPSGLWQNGKLYRPKHDYQVDPGRLAFGQERLLVTPLQAAMIAAGIANRGVVMRPYLIDRVLAPSGKVISRTRAREYRRAVKPQTAAQVTAMMVAAVESGTGTAARIPGIRVAGKTGTAETGLAGRYTTSFIAFAPAERPRVAVAVFLENQTGYGGTTAAPIAKAIMQALLGPGSNP
ncbi:MAG: penicillin-binding protein 2 [Actinomycetota bacterium]|nr:penicillin-binding protein 2 [Actinomycetota bacterium]